MMEKSISPLRLKVKVNSIALDEVNDKNQTVSLCLYKFFAETSQTEIEALGKLGVIAVVDAVFTGRKILNPETDDEFIKRLTGMVFGFNDDDEQRLLEIAKRLLKKSKAK